MGASPSTLSSPPKIIQVPRHISSSSPSLPSASSSSSSSFPPISASPFPPFSQIEPKFSQIDPRFAGNLPANQPLISPISPSVGGFPSVGNPAGITPFSSNMASPKRVIPQEQRHPAKMPKLQAEDTEDADEDTPRIHGNATTNETLYRVVTQDGFHDDGYRWRKYGQKTMKGSPFPRSYYKCTTSGCAAKKLVESVMKDGKEVTVASYRGSHSHPPPLKKPSNSGSSLRSEKNDDDSNENADDEDPLDDGYQWRRTGAPPGKEGDGRMMYYVCAEDGCSASRHVAKIGDQFNPIYFGSHSH